MNGMWARLLVGFWIGGAPILVFGADVSKSCAEPQFRGGASHAAVYCSDPVRRLGGVRWKFQTEGPVHSSPVVSEGVVFFGSGDGRLYAVDQASGKEIWRFQAGGPVDSTPAVKGEVVYFESANRFVH